MQRIKQTIKPPPPPKEKQTWTSYILFSRKRVKCLFKSSFLSNYHDDISCNQNQTGIHTIVEMM